VFLGKGLLTQLGLSSDSERLTIQSGEQAPVEEGGKSTYYLEFKLSQRWSLVAEYTRFNEFNAGLKWRIYSR
jgi:hypothetical protein